MIWKAQSGIYMKNIGGSYRYASKTITLGAGEYIFNLYSAVFSTDGYLIIYKEKVNGNTILNATKKCGTYNLKLEEQTVLVIVFQVSLMEDVTNGEYKLYYSIYDKLSTIIPKEYTGVDAVENKVDAVENKVEPITGNIIKNLINFDNITYDVSDTYTGLVIMMLVIENTIQLNL